ncbi:hypothetical protein VNO77_33197 [Canavalia gladiata]|uniref:Uncharacterized protein n=1 Tax=Canavalia gladiata TaxID=3824 RepID=A0AAN9KBX9_CANGL
MIYSLFNHRHCSEPADPCMSSIWWENFGRCRIHGVVLISNKITNVTDLIDDNEDTMCNLQPQTARKMFLFNFLVLKEQECVLHLA